MQAIMICTHYLIDSWLKDHGHILFAYVFTFCGQQVPEYPDDGGHDVINNFEFPCNSMENLISIWKFTNTVIKNVK